MDAWHWHRRWIQLLESISNEFNASMCVQPETVAVQTECALVQTGRVISVTPTVIAHNDVIYRAGSGNSTRYRNRRCRLIFIGLVKWKKKWNFLLLKFLNRMCIEMVGGLLTIKHDASHCLAAKRRQRISISPFEAHGTECGPFYSKIDFSIYSISHKKYHAPHENRPLVRIRMNFIVLVSPNDSYTKLWNMDIATNEFSGAAELTCISNGMATTRHWSVERFWHFALQWH